MKVGTHVLCLILGGMLSVFHNWEKCLLYDYHILPLLFWSRFQCPFFEESWTVKKAERRRIDAFELWCWRRLLRVPWTARRFNQSILKEISPGYSLEGLMLRLKLQYFGHLMWRAGSLEKTLNLGKIEGGRKRGRQRMKWMASLNRWTWRTGDWRAAVHEVAKSRTWLSNWTELKVPSLCFTYNSYSW